MQINSIKSGVNILKIAIALLGVLICAVILGIWDGDAKNIGDIDGWLETGLYVSYIALGLSVAAVLIFGIARFFGNLKANMGVLIGIVAFVVILLLSIFALADGTVYESWANASSYTEMDSKVVGGGLISVYIMGAVSILLIIYVELNKAFK